MGSRIFLALALTVLTGAAPAQTTAPPPSDLTSAEGAAFMHQVLKDQMLSFKQDGDNDLIYFTAILGWRCGLRELYYGLNDDPIVMQFPLEPCYREMRQPNSMPGAGTTYPIHITVPTGSAQKLRLRMIYDDGNTASFEVERVKNLMF